MTPVYVLDANAILNLVERGPEFRKVEQLLHSASRQQISVLVSVMNWGEVFYWLWPRVGEERARQTLATLSRLPFQIIPVDLPQALKAGELKAMHHIPYVDCIAAALAVAQKATLVTSDRHFEKLGRHFHILWMARL